MNIFVLDKDAKIAAQLHVDKHVCKQSIEYAQLLSAAHHRWQSPLAPLVYKMTHRNHPATKWVGDHPEHYEWTYALAEATWDEYTYRYGKIHGSARLRDLLKQRPPIIAGGHAVPPPQCMPEPCRVHTGGWEATIAAYQDYYRIHKRDFAAWKKRDVPTFMMTTPQTMLNTGASI